MLYIMVRVDVTAVICVLADTVHITVSVGVAFVVCVLADGVRHGQ